MFASLSNVGIVILLLIWSLSLRIVAPTVTKEECNTMKHELPLSEIVRQMKMEDTLIPHILTQTPDDWVLPLFMDRLDSYCEISRKSLPSSRGYSTRSGKQAPQFKIGRYGGTLVLFFQGTANVKDVWTDLNIDPQRRDIALLEASATSAVGVEMKESPYINVHAGVASMIDDEGFLLRLQKEILWACSWDPLVSLRERDRLPPLCDRFIISGHSLGGALAIYLYLKLYVGLLDPHAMAPESYVPLLQQQGFHLLPQDVSGGHVTVITYGAPFVVQNAINIPDPAFEAHVFNFVNFRDPVPMLLAGMLGSEGAGRPKTSAWGTGAILSTPLRNWAIYQGYGHYIVLYSSFGHPPHAPDRRARAPAGHRYIDELIRLRNLRKKEHKRSEKHIYRWFRLYVPSDPNIAFGNLCFRKITKTSGKKLYSKTSAGYDALNKHPMKTYKKVILEGPVGRFIYTKSDFWGERMTGTITDLGE